jgi:hypothetical protein
MLGHDRDLLPRLGNPIIQEMDLNELTYPEKWAGFPMHTLGESRVYFSKEFLEGLPEFVGTLTYRFDEKFKPNIPLTTLATLLAKRRLKKNDVWGIRFGSRDWMEDSERFHPGMKVLLEDVAGHFQREINPDGPAPYCNNFVCHRDHFLELAAFIEESMTYVLDKYGERLPFVYASPCCGEVNATGLGRYRNNDRHLSFFVERLTMLYFSSKLGLRKRHFSTITLGGKAKVALKTLLHPMVPLVKQAIRWYASEHLIDQQPLATHGPHR